MAATPIAQYNLLHAEAESIRTTPYGSVGQLYAGEGLEAVWVRKEAEAIDPGWFSQSGVDLLLVVAGGLRVEFEATDLAPRVLIPGDLMVLPANTRCRAYRWPRDSQAATVFLAVYPQAAAQPSSGGHA
jgi:hypothetical protein